MLIKKPIQENDIITLKLISGEEVIAKYVGQDAGAYHLSKPLVLAPGPKGMVLAPFIITAEELAEVHIIKTALVTVPFRTQQAVKNSYIEFTTGIKTSTAGTNIPPLTV
jgi:hypothetical protein